MISIKRQRQSSQTETYRTRLRRYYTFIGSRGDAEHQQLSGAYAITFSPGRSSHSFLDRPIRPLGTTEMIVIGYETIPSTGSRRMPVRGFRAECDPSGQTHRRSVAFRASKTH